jgi:hypothetical protein
MAVCQLEQVHEKSAHHLAAHQILGRIEDTSTGLPSQQQNG